MGGRAEEGGVGRQKEIQTVMTPSGQTGRRGHNVLNLSVRLFVRLFVTKLVNTMF